MATSVPDTNTFNLKDVKAVVGGDDLETCYANSVDSFFDSYYRDHDPDGNPIADKSSLYNFRNYTESAILQATIFAQSDYLQWFTRYYYSGSIGTDWAESLGWGPIVSQKPATGIHLNYSEQYRTYSEQIGWGNGLYSNARWYAKFYMDYIPSLTNITDIRLKIKINNTWGAEYGYANQFGPLIVTESDEWDRQTTSTYGARWIGGVIQEDRRIAWTGAGNYFLEIYFKPSQFFKFQAVTASNHKHIALLTNEDYSQVPPPWNSRKGIEISKDYRPHLIINYTN